MFRTLGFAALLGAALVAFACSSSDSPSSSSSSSSSSSGSPVPTCSCTGQTSGQSFEVACGSSQCVAGSTYTCPTAGNLVVGARCGDSDSGVASGQGCELIACQSQVDCAPVGSCFAVVDGGVFCYPPPDGDGTTCANGETATTLTTPNGPSTFCVPAGCPVPKTYVP